jgi:hypothetical protein
MKIEPERLEDADTQAFASQLLQRLKSADPAELPLRQSSLQGGMIDPDSLQFSLVQCEADEHQIQVRIQVIFQELRGGCSCGFEAEPQPGQSEWLLRIDKDTSITKISVTQ